MFCGTLLLLLERLRIGVILFLLGGFAAAIDSVAKEQNDVDVAAVAAAAAAVAVVSTCGLNAELKFRRVRATGVPVICEVS